MRRWLAPVLAAAVGCHTCPVADVSPAVEAHIHATAAWKAPVEPPPCAPEALPVPVPLDLPTLWALALEHQPALREAAADVEAARGRLTQSQAYPNPHFLFEEEELGTSQAPAGTIRAQVTQEIVTAGKRRLDRDVALRGTDVASVALLGRKLDVAARVRRGYFDYLAAVETARVGDEVVAALEQGVEITRKTVEVAKTRPRTDLLRLQALLEEARINQARNRVHVQAAWRQLAADVGVPHLPPPIQPARLPEAVPAWDYPAVEQRVLTANPELTQAGLEADRARLEAERARAEAVPNVTLGTGYSQSFIENSKGAILSVETPVPLWDRKQGQLHEAEARWARARAAVQSTANRLSRDTAEAFARYEAARQQVERLTADVLPRLVEGLDLLRKGYQAGATQVTFADVLLAEQTLNESRLALAAARRDLWHAAADLQGLMGLDIGEELGEPGAVCPPGTPGAK